MAIHTFWYESIVHKIGKVLINFCDLRPNTKNLKGCEFETDEDGNDYYRFKSR